MKIMTYIIGGTIGICLIPFALIIATPDFIRSIRSAKW